MRKKREKLYQKTLFRHVFRRYKVSVIRKCNIKMKQIFRLTLGKTKTKTTICSENKDDDEMKFLTIFICLMY